MNGADFLMRPTSPKVTHSNRYYFFCSSQALAAINTKLGVSKAR